MSHTRSRLVFKILSPDDYAAAQETGATATALDLADGFVHLSEGPQVAATLEAHFASARTLYLLAFDPKTFGDDLKPEASRGGEMFPHLYGALKLSDAVDTWLLKRGEDTGFLLPEETRKR